MKKTDFQIGNRSDALALLDEMLGMIKKIDAGYYWPRLEALRDAIEREVV